VGGRDPRGAGHLPKSLSRWLRITLIANRITGPLPLPDAIDVAGVLVATGRAIPAPAWVDELIDKRRNERLESMF
jgi:hypothetical protein